jgi:hypothetical protein
MDDDNEETVDGQRKSYSSTTCLGLPKIAKPLHKRHSLTLIEVVIAAFLCSLIFTFLIQSYMDTQRQRIAIGPCREQTLLSSRIYLRLAPLFSHLKESSKTEILATPHTLNGGIACTFDNGIDPSPEFCHRITGQLFLDQKQRLCLKTIGSEHKIREEVLCEGVRSLQFSFFDPEIAEWQKQCSVENLAAAPKMIKLEIVFKDFKTPPLEWVFFTHLRNEPIVPKKKL